LRHPFITGNFHATRSNDPGTGFPDANHPLLASSCLDGAFTTRRGSAHRCQVLRFTLSARVANCSICSAGLQVHAQCRSAPTRTNADDGLDFIHGKSLKKSTIGRRRYPKKAMTPHRVQEQDSRAR
jgi:hypothetical protein